MRACPHTYLRRVKNGVAAGLAVLALAAAPGAVPKGAAGPPGGANCGMVSVGYTPLVDLGTGTYQGAEGGLYPGGANRPPDPYRRLGIAHAQRITPLGAGGRPDPAGAIVLLSVGMSNTTMEFSAFKRLADLDPSKSPRVTIVDGAQGGQDAIRVAAPDAPFWSGVDERLRRAGVSGQQVQAVWLKEAIAGEHEAFPTDARRLQQALVAIVGILERRYPHVQIVYVSNRTYAGYATTRLNPEPYAYESGFAVKWLIADQIKTNAAGPWVAWGPYLWTDGERGRGDGLAWTCLDVGPDGTHPSMSGVRKIAGLLLNFFTAEETAKSWFVGR